MFSSRVKVPFVCLTMVSIIGLGVACGSEKFSTGTSQIKDDRIPASRFEAPDLLDALSTTPNNSRIRARADVTEAQLDAAFNSLNGKLRLDPVQSRLKLDGTFGGALTPSQKTGFLNLQRGHDTRVSEGAVKVLRGQIVPADGRYALTGPGLIQDNLNQENQLDSLDGLSEAASGAAPDHRVGDGRWSWNLSYKWWGVRLSVNHNFLNYLCNNTEWLLGRAGLPGWIKIVIRPLGCLVHRLDSGADGASISITWSGVFWYSA